MKPLETKTEDQLISISEASKLTGYNRDYIGRLVSRGEIAGQRVGRNWLTTPAALKAFFGGSAEVVAAPAGPVLSKAAPGLLGAVAFAICSTLMLVLVYMHTQGGVGAGSLGVIGKALVPWGLAVTNEADTTDRSYTTNTTNTEQGAALGDADSVIPASEPESSLALGSGSRVKPGMTNQPGIVLGDGASVIPASEPESRVWIPGQARNDKEGVILGDSISLQPQPVNFSTLGISEYDLNQLIAQQLTNLASIGLLRPAPESATGAGLVPSPSSSTYNPTTYNSTTPSGPPVISYIQPAPAQNFNGASLLSATDLSSTRFTTTTANITDTATIKTLSVTENASIDGDLTITGNITGNVIGTINPSFTLGSIPFQGASNLTQDNSNLFWDNTNKRLGVGTSSPTATVQIKSTGGVGDNNGLIVTNANASVRLLSNFATSNEVGLYDSNDAGIAVSNVNSGVFKYAGGDIEVHSSGGNVLLGLQGGGNVGIGTTTPAARLMVENTSGAATPNVLAYTPGINGLTRYQAKNDTARTVNLDMFGSNYYGISSLANSGGVGTGESPFIVYTDATTGATGGTNPIYFSPGGYNNIKVTFTSGGNVGIGTTSPAGNLHVYAGSDSQLVVKANGIEGLSLSSNSSDGSDNRAIFLDSAKDGLSGTRGAFVGVYGNEHASFPGRATVQGSTIILSGGNVGIGTTSPSDVLHVNGSIVVPTGNYIYASGSGTLMVGDGNDNVNIVGGKLYVANSGNVGIGTTAPTKALDVVGEYQQTGNALIIGTYGTATRGSYISSTAGYNNTNYSGLFLDENSQNGTSQANTGVASWRMLLGGGTSEWNGGDAFTVARVAAGGTFSNPTKLFSVTSAGNVGIGTTTPASLLSVGSGTPTSAANGLNFGTDTAANLYRSAAGVVKTDGYFGSAQSVFANTFGNNGNTSSGAGFYGTHPGSGTNFSQFNDAATISSGVTNSYLGFDTRPSTAASVFTLSTLTGVNVGEEQKALVR